MNELHKNELDKMANEYCRTRNVSMLWFIQNDGISILISAIHKSRARGKG